MAVHEPQSSNPFFAQPHILCLLEREPLHLLCDLYLGEAFCPGLRCSKTLPAASASLSVPLRLGKGAIPSALSSASDLCIRKEAWNAASSQAPASVLYTAVCIYSSRSTPLTRRSKSSAWSFASSRTLSWPKPALPLWLAASVRPKTFMPRACAMMTSFTVDMPT